MTHSCTQTVCSTVKKKGSINTVNLETQHTDYSVHFLSSTIFFFFICAIMIKTLNQTPQPNQWGLSIHYYRLTGPQGEIGGHQQKLSTASRTKNLWGHLSHG